MPTTLSRSAYLNGLTGGLVRLLLALAGFLMTALTQEPGITFAAYLAGAYAVFALVHWATCLWQPRWTVPVTVVLDVAAAAGFVWLAPASMPGWVLLLFPVLLAGGAGLLPTLLAGSLAVVAYAAALLLAGTTPGGASVWPVVVLASAAIAIALLPSHWMSAGKERLAWAQAAVAEENYLRERALARIATDLTSFDRVTLEQVLVAAVHEGLRAVGQILERDAVPGPPDAPRSHAVAVGLAESAARDRLQRAAVALHGGRELVVQRLSLLTSDELAWLERLAGAGSAALARYAEHAALLAEEARLRETWRSSPTPAALLSGSGELVYGNDQYNALRLEQAQPVPSPGGTSDYEVSAGEPPRIFVLTKTPVADGAPVADSALVLVTYREITNERAALRARDELLSLVGHELRGPLTSIHGFNQMMARNLGVVQQQAAQLDRLIGDLMSTSALERGQLSLDLQPTDVSKLVKSAAERFAVGSPDRQLRLSVQSGQEMRADAARLNQVVDNLLTNADKYSPPEMPIELGLEHRDTALVLWVKDRGAGIAPEHLERLFDRFYRTPDAEHKQVKGLGLGLAIVQDLVTAHGGRVWAESDGPGEGSTFYVSLPVPRSAGDGDPDTARLSKAQRE